MKNHETTAVKDIGIGNMQQVHISKMTGKLDGFKAISTNTITNDYCNKQHVKGKQDGKNICGDCYSHAMLNTYRKNMQAALQRNSDLLSSRPLEPHEIPRVTDAMFRLMLTVS